MLTELPDKQKYYEMALTDLRNATYDSIRTWQREVLAEKSRRIEAAKKSGQPLSTEVEEDLFEVLLKNATPAIMDLVFINTEIEKIYEERLGQAAENILAYKSKAARIKGVIKLFGLKFSYNTDLPNKIARELKDRGVPAITDTLNDLDHAEAAQAFLRDNFNAFIKELKRQEEAEAKKQARRRGKLETGLQPVNGFIEAYQGPITHQLSRRHMKGDPGNPGLFDHLIDDLGKATIQAGGMTIYIDNYNEAIKKLDDDSTRLNDLAAAKAKQTNSDEVFFSTAEYMRLRQLKDPKYARQELKAAKEGLYSVSIRIEAAAKGQKEPSTRDFRLFQETADDGGTNIGLKYSERAFQILQGYVQPFDMDPRAFALDGLSYSIYRRLLEHKTINARKTKEGEDPTLKPENKIGVITILEGTRLPTEAQVLAKYGPKLSEKILQPFEKSMETLVDQGILREWYYIGVNDARVDPPKNYRQFEGLNIRFQLDKEPDTAKLEEYRERQEKLFEEEKRRAERKAVRKAIEAKNAESEKK